MDRGGHRERYYGYRVFCDVKAYVSCREYAICRYSAKCTGRTVNQGGTAGDFEFDARPWQNQILPETGVFGF